MASARGRWLRDHTSARFGACMTASVGAGPPSGTSGGAVCELAVVGVVAGALEEEEEAGEDVVADSSWRAVVLK
jgi:hypothetical protein